MQAIKFKVKCKDCQHPNIVAVAEAMLGKDSLRRCESCLQMFPFSAPDREKVDLLMGSLKTGASPGQGAQSPEEEFRTTIRPASVNSSRILVLEVQAGEFGPSKQFEISQPYTTIGRSSTEPGCYRADIPLQTSDAYLSRKHAVVKKYANSFTISDAGSANGTSLNDIRLGIGEELVLADGDQITIGRTRILTRIS